MKTSMKPILLAAWLSAAPAWAAPPVAPPLAAPVPAADPRIEVFTVSSLPVTAPPGTPVYELDRLRTIEAELSAGLPSEPAQAARIAQARIVERGETLNQAALAAGTGAGLALHYGIDRVPAIVLDGRYVVFGETSVERALAHWRRATQQEAR